MITSCAGSFESDRMEGEMLYRGLWAGIVAVSAIAMPAAAIAEDVACKGETDNINAIKSKYDPVYQGYQHEGEDIKKEGEVSIGGTIDWKDTEMIFDTPTVTMKDQRLVFGVPQVTMKQNDIIFHTPSVRMERMKTGQYPEFFCEDTWIEIWGVKTKGVPK
jgi:hypothetical protein